MKERRRFERHRKTLLLSVKPVTGATRTFATHDVSQGGAFLEALVNEQLPVGTAVVITPVNNGAGIPPAPIKARIVRSNAQGMGVEFMDADET